MSVDKSSESFDLEETEASAQKIFKKLKLDWQNVYDPKGWVGILHQFNASGYGLILVDPKGLVRGVNLHAKEVETQLQEIYPSRG